MESRGAVVIFLIASVMAAQTAPCHKGSHQDGYRMTVKPAPPIRTGIGSSDMPISTKSAQAKQYFQQGIALLHCFWEFEAYRSFQEASRLDPDAVMPYWGIVQAIGEYKAMDAEKQAALGKIKVLLPKADTHEAFYLRAQHKQQEKDGDEAYRLEMQALIAEYPDDIDARLFLALGLPEKDRVFGVSLLDNVLAAHPDHPAANHYRIHLLEDGPHADRAISSADRLATLHMASGHMVHMPGHIYFKTGDQDRARTAFLASRKVDEDYMARENVSPIDDWNYAHNLSYLVASDSEAGRFQEAAEIAAKLDSLALNPFLAQGKPLHAVSLGASAVRLQLRFGRWQAVIDHPVRTGEEAEAGPAAVTFRDGIDAYARGMLALETNQFDQAAIQADALDALQWRLQTASEDSDEIHPDPVIRNLKIASLDLRGNLLCARGKLDEGLALLKAAVEKEKKAGYQEPPQYSRPEWESLGYAYLRAGQFDNASEAFRSELKVRPKSGHALYGLALTAEKRGRKNEAILAYLEFLNAWKSADPDLEMVRHARLVTQPGAQPQ